MSSIIDIHARYLIREQIRSRDHTGVGHQITTSCEVAQVYGSAASVIWWQSADQKEKVVWWCGVKSVFVFIYPGRVENPSIRSGLRPNFTIARCSDPLSKILFTDC